MIPGYIAEHPDFREIGERMMAEWDKGVNGWVVDTKSKPGLFFES